MSRRPIQLRINKLVLPETMADDPNGIGGALERELARLLADQGLPSGLETSHHLGQVNGGTLETGPEAAPESAGANIAKAIYGSLQH